MQGHTAGDLVTPAVEPVDGQPQRQPAATSTTATDGPSVRVVLGDGTEVRLGIQHLQTAVLIMQFVVLLGILVDGWRGSS